MKNFIDLIIFHDDDKWVVIGVGTQRDGSTLCHLASATRGRQQKNGWAPVQIIDWVSNEVLEAAAKYESGTWIKGTEDDDDEYEYIPSAAELS